MLGLFAGDAGRAYREGKDLDEAGSDYKAATKYLESLAADSGQKKALEGLKAVASDAYNQKLEEAQSNEGSGRFADALASYKDLTSLVKGLNEWSAVSFSVIDLPGKVKEMTDKAAEAAYQTATAAYASQDWNQAILSYEAAVTLIPNYKDCSEKIQVGFYKWAEGDLAAKRYRDAINHFSASATHGSTSDAKARASAIELAFARYFIEHGACRQGVVDAKAALGLLSSPASESTLKSAQDCAMTPITMASLENPTGVNPSGMAVGDLLADKILAEVRNGASEYLTVIERESLAAVIGDQGAASVAAGSVPKGVKGVRYVVLGKITQLKLENVPAVAKATNGTATEMYDCPRTKSDGTTVMARCPRDIAIVYDDYVGHSLASVSLSVRVVDAATGTQLGLENVEDAWKDDVHYVQNARLSSGQPLVLSMDGHPGTVTNEDLRRLMEAPQALESADDLLPKALNGVAGKSAKVILHYVDEPAAITDPSSLTIP